MKEMDEIENLFSSAFANEGITPPNSVKKNIDRKLFGAKTVWDVFYTVIGIVIISGFIGTVLSEDIVLAESKSIETDNIYTNNDFKLKKELNVVTLSGNSTTTKIEDAFNESNIKTKFTENKSSTAKYSTTPIVNQNKTRKYQDYKANESNLIPFVANGKTSTKQFSQDQNEANNNRALTNADSFPSNYLHLNALNIQEHTSNFQHLGSLEDTPANSRQLKNELLDQYGTVDHLAFLSASKFNLLSPELNTTTKKFTKKNKRLLTLSLYNGFNLGANKLESSNNNVQISENVGFLTAINLDLRLKYRLGVGMGIEYANHQEAFIETIQTLGDSLIINSYYQYFQNPNDSSLIDSTLVTEYGQVIIDQENEYKIQQSSFSIPISIHYYKTIGARMDFKISALAKFSFLKSRLISDLDNGALVYSKFSLSMGIRPELRYHWTHMGIGLYGQLSKDFSTPSTWNSTTRNRFNYGGGVSIFVNF